MSKKLISLFIAAMMLIALVPAASFAKGEPVQVKNDNVVVSWGFEETNHGWTFVDSDGDEKNWYVYNASYYAHSGNNLLCSESYNGGALTPDNWAISPEVELPDEDGLTLTYYVANYISSYKENYQVYVGTSSEIDDMTAITDLITVGSSTYSEETLDLTAYRGQTVHIAFRHHSVTDKFKLFLDDISITLGAPESLIPITEIYINGVDMPPLAGDSAQDHLNLTVPADAPYSIKTKIWYDNATYSIFSGSFVAGDSYYMRIVVEPAEGYEFAGDVEVYINGSDEFLDWGVASGDGYAIYTVAAECIARLGDVNFDGEVDASDVTLAMRCVLGIEGLTDEQILAGDVNGDGEISIDDVILIMRYALSIITTFPIE
ncbi:MAG: choice-of-anchor J domain-containing protein [Clostridia bacterium]|nr:choice-of-anchor J domain-containing protein [Clostridia bacterium]